MSKNNQDKLIDYRIKKLFGLDSYDLEIIDSGLINNTWVVKDNGKPRSVIQRVNKIFPKEINKDIDNITKFLLKNNFKTPLIIPSITGEIFIEIDGYVWRHLSYIEGHNYNCLKNKKQARSAGELLGRFHKIFNNCDYNFSYVKKYHYNFSHYKEEITKTLINKKDHRNINIVKEISNQIFNLSELIPNLDDSHLRKVHGDPKITNIIFNDNDEAICLIDLDTLGERPIYYEIGDALRSWCNQKSEDHEDSILSLSYFKNVVEGYAVEGRDILKKIEYENILPSFLFITLELSARFCVDALNESFFSWNNKIYNSHSEHNIIRSKGQLNLAKQIQDNFDALQKVVLTSFR